MKQFHCKFVWLLAYAFLLANCRAALVGPAGYTNSFGSLPAAADWSTVLVPGAAADLINPTALDAAATAVAASSVNFPLTGDATDPPALLTNATWCSSAFYVQTRPTGVGATLLMCTLVNNLGANASGAIISYDFAKVAPATEEVDGQRAYYSLTGAGGSWTLIPQFSTATGGRLSATLNFNWPNGGTFYILWADDNGSGSPDTAFQIDNFSAIATVPVPVSIPNPLPSQTVQELAPANFGTAVIGNPTPTYQWYKNAMAINGATNLTYNIPSVALADNGSQFHLIAANTVSNINYSATSSVAVLTVNADMTAPTLAGAVGIPPNSVSVEFSEALRADTANVAGNYAITSAVGNLTVSGAALQASGSNVLLTTSPQTLNIPYTLIVNGVRDLSVASNRIAPNSLIAFTSVSLASADVGAPAVTGQVAPAGNGANITAGGTNINGTSDQFTMAYVQISGNFDYKVRVAAISLADMWSKACLMARDTLVPNSPFAAAVATPGPSGTFFASRTTAGGAAAYSGNGPVNYPNTWLRVSRSGSTFTAYCGVDGSSWFQLGSATITMANTIYIGMAVSASVTNGSAIPSATAQFREFMANTSTAVATSVSDVEPPGPSSRRTPIAITEIMYNPLPNPNSNILEFVEIYNSNPYYEDISGYRISGDIDYVFPPNTRLQAGEYRVIARNPAHVMAAYPITGVWGAYSNSLREAGTVRLRNREDAILLEVNYDNSPPWPAAADGAGHSLVLARPSYGEGHPKAWAQSDKVGGSPGGFDGAGSNPQRNVVINEFLANSDGTNVDYIELYNHSNQQVDLAGCTLSDDPHLNKFTLPSNTRIDPHSFLVFDQATLGFGLSSGGETIYLRNADGSRVLDAVRFGAQAANVAAGRYPDGAGEFYPLSAPTPGAANAPIRIDDIVINEIMYRPVSAQSDDEYVELCNKGTNAVNLGGWKFTAGIDYKFPSNTMIAAGAYVVVAKDAARLMSNYPNLNTNNTFGNFKGSLKNTGDRVALGRPDTNVTTNGMGQVQTNNVHVIVDEVAYGVGGKWGNWANEGGSSLELIDARANHRLGYNWADSEESTKAAWTTIQAYGNIDLGAGTANLIEILAIGEGEFLVDNVEVLPGTGGANFLTAGNANLDSGIGNWTPRGTHVRTTWDATGGVSNSACLHVRASERGDSVANRVTCTLTAVPAGTVTIRAQVRWLKGWPEVLFRLHGNYMEAFGRMNVPANPGTPGLPNSRAVSNAPPAIYQVVHAPILPAANQAVVVTARVEDPDGVSAVTLNYRVDPAAGYSPVPMLDNGTGGDAVAGDGIYSGTIPGQSAGLVAFQVAASDSRGAGAVFPQQIAGNYALPFEALVRFGDPVLFGGFGTYRQWLTAAAVSAWSSRAALSNEKVYGTFVNGNFRVIYNMTTRWNGSPYHQFGGAPGSDGHYSIDFPADDIMLGTDSFHKIHMPGNGPGDDNTIQREQTCYWFARQLGLPYNYRRNVNMVFNGARRGGTTLMMEDTETPGADVIESRYPDDADGNLYKLQPWFEQDVPADATTRSVGGAGNQSWCLLNRFTTPSNGVPVYKTARYRNNYLVRAANGTANDYAPVFALIDAANTPTNGWTAHTAAIESLIDVEEWTRIWAVCHAVGDWDHVGTQNAQNMYGYKPAHGKWQLLIWDMNIVLGNSGSWGAGVNLVGTYTSGETVMQGIYANPKFRRMFLRGLKELATGPMMAANVEPHLDAKYNAYVASGITPTAPSAAVKGDITSRRTSILSTVAAEDAPVFKITVPNPITSSSNLITLTGEAPLETYSIRINGVDYLITWTGVRTWSIRVAVTDPATTLTLQGYDIRGNLLSGFTTNVTVNFTGVVENPVGSVVFNEVLYEPLVPDASFVELFNVSTTTGFDIGNWRVNGLDYTFPSGSTIAPRQFLVLAKKPAAFYSAFGYGLTVAGNFDGDLDRDGETLTLIKPATTNTPEVVVNKLRYENRAPWPEIPPGSDLSLQLIDARRDTSRVSNWGVNRNPWSLVTFTGTIQAGVVSFLIYFPLTAGDVYIDDIVLVTGTIPDEGPNLLQDGDFETPLAGSWAAIGTHSGSVISSDVAHSGASSLHLIATGSGGAASTVKQTLPTLASNTVCTLSFWFLPATNGSAITMRTTPGSNFNPPNPYFNIQPHLFPSSPGTLNQLAFNRPPYDPIWLNELQPNNLTGRTDNNGEREPWIEIYNAGTSNIDLSAYYLANNYSSNLTQWQFPAGSSLAPGEFRLIWADSQIGQTSGTNAHANFRLGPGEGTVSLNRIITGQPQITDYLTYSGIGPDLSYGDFPDGQPFTRQTFFAVTPGSTNSAHDVNVFINEWMASNLSFNTDPADGNPDDWFELFNPSDDPVDLTDYYLTDDLNNPRQYRIPSGYVIPPHGFLLVWADSDTGQNHTNRPDLHVSFKLNTEAESIGLYSPNGFTPIDTLTYTNQTDNVSEGRFSDGAATRYFMTTPTPGAPNTIGLANTAPTLDPIPDHTLRLGQTLNLTAVGHDSDFPLQTLSFSLDAHPAGALITSGGQFSWTPSGQQAPSTNTVGVRVSDNAPSPLSATTSFTVFVRLPPVVSIMSNGSQVAIGFDAIPGRTYRVEWKEQLDDLWNPLGPPVLATGDVLIINDNIGANSQRFYRTVQLD